MSKIQSFAEITPSLPFSEFISYEAYRRTFEKTERGRIKRLLPLHVMRRASGWRARALHGKTDQSQKDGDGIFVHLLRTPHRESHAIGRRVDGAKTGGGRIVELPERFRNSVLDVEVEKQRKIRAMKPGLGYKTV